MQRILITGASGFIGKGLCRTALDKGFTVTAIYRALPDHVSNAPHHTAEIVNDINGSTEWGRALTDCNSVIHLAGCAHRKASPEEYTSVNVEGTLQLAKQAIAAGVQRFIFVSSIGVNGAKTTKGQRFSEQDAPMPENAYSISKLQAEQALKSLASTSNMAVVIIRPPLVYSFAAPGNFKRLLSLIKTGLPLPFESIHNQRSFVSLENLVDALLLCTTQPAAANETFLISDGKDLSTPEFLGLIANALQLRLRLFPFPTVLLKIMAACIGQKTSATALCDSLVIDSSKIRKTLQWRPAPPKLAPTL